MNGWALDIHSDPTCQLLIGNFKETVPLRGYASFVFYPLRRVISTLNVGHCVPFCPVVEETGPLSPTDPRKISCLGNLWGGIVAAEKAANVQEREMLLTWCGGARKLVRVAGEGW